MPSPGRSNRARPTLYLVDAMGLLFRAHFAFAGRPLTTRDGRHVGALLGFLNALLALVREEGAQHLAVAFETPEPTFRHELYPDYKAHRPPPPPELLEQIPQLERIVAAFGLTALARPGFEADDLIGSLAAQCRQSGWQAVIVSADKDFGQCLGPVVRQYVPSRGREPARWIDAAALEAKWGVTPEQFVDFLALTGDSSDNVPGVRGIGPKRAAALLQAHGSLAAIYDDLTTVEPASLRGKLEAGREAAALSRRLVALRTDAQRADLERLAVPDPATRPALRDLLREFEFRRLEERLYGENSPSPPVQGSLLASATPAQQGGRDGGRRDGDGDEDPTAIADGWAVAYTRLATPDALAAALRDYGAECGPLAVDTETDGLDPRSAPLVGVSFGWRAGEAWYAPVGHQAGEQLALEDLRRHLGPHLADPAVAKVMHHAQFDLPVLARHGLEVRGQLHDTMIAAYVCDPEGRFKLDTLVAEWLDHRMVPITALIGSGRRQRPMSSLRPERVAPYACEDADAVVRLWPRLAQRLQAVGGEALYRELEMPLVPVLVAMEAEGIGVDPGVLAAMGATLEAELRRAEEAIHALAGESFNVQSTQQLQAVLFERLKLKPGRRTKTGYSTDQAVLERLAVEHPLPRAILEYRQIAKLKSTYVEALPRMIDARTGRIHTELHQTGTATGRLSSSHPNLQNIPIRTAVGREIRKAFVARPGHELLSADYSQIELRLLAHFSGDAYLTEAFRAGADIHRATAARVFGVAPERVDPQLRMRAKTVNFGIVYGMGAQRLAAQLDIPVAEAAAFIEAYFERLPGVRAYVDRCVETARQRGYAETLAGRRRYLPDLEATHPRDRAAAERMALNTTIQGSAADLIKRAMIALHVQLQREASGARLVLQVHDELLFEVPATDRAELAARVCRAMEAVGELAVPLRVETGHGRSWFEAHA